MPYRALPEAAPAAPTTADAPAAAPRWIRSRWLLLALFFLAFGALDQFIAAGQPEAAIPAWDLAGGLGFCLMALRGPAWAPAVLFADLAAQLLHPAPHPWPRLVTESLLNAGTGALAAVYLRRTGGLALDRQADLLRLVGAASAAGFVQATAAVLFAAGRLAAPALDDTFAEALIGILLGVLIVAPVLLSLPMLRWRGERRTVLLAAAQGALLIAILAWTYPPPEGDRFRYFYLLFLPQIWIAVRFSTPGAALSALVVQIWLVVFAALRPEDVGPLLNYKFRVLALTISALFLAVSVAERRLVENALRQRQEQFAQVARLSLAGEMAAALAHQLNQPLAAAMAFAHAAQRRLAGREPAGSPLMQAIDGAVAEVDRAGGIVRTLRSFVGRSEPARKTASLDEIMREALALAEPECARAGVRLTWTPQRPLPPVSVNTIEVQQVILNLIQNAVDSLSRASGTKSIAVTARRAADGRAEVEVRDTGPGVPPDMLERLFEPFTSTKPTGMGLGLLISRGIIESHGGRIWLAENGPGACAFRFTLPAGRSDALEVAA